MCVSTLEITVIILNRINKSLTYKMLCETKENQKLKYFEKKRRAKNEYKNFDLFLINFD